MRVIHLGQAFLSGYAAYHSYNAITNLQAYEATSEKLAEWSNEAAKQLAQTRATQTTGALTVCTLQPHTYTTHLTNHRLLPDPALISDVPHSDLLPGSFAYRCSFLRLASFGHCHYAGAWTYEELLGAQGRQDCGRESAAA